MGIKGRKLEVDIPLEEVEKSIMDNFGRLRGVAEELGCSVKALYDLLDIYPELQDARKKASKRYRDAAVEDCEAVLAKIREMVEEDTTNARHVAQYVLSKTPDSPYYDGPAQDESQIRTDTLIANIERYVGQRTAK